MDIRLEQSAGQPVAVVRRFAKQSEFSKVIPAACGTVWNAVKALGIKAGRNVAIYLDAQFNLEVGVEVLEPFAGQGEVVPSTIPAGPVATATHFGPYHLLGPVHEAIQNWMKANGHAIGPSWEIYGHWKDEWNRDPSLIRTDVYYLLTASK